MSLGFRVSQQDPVFPVAVLTRPALESLAKMRRTKLGLVLTLEAICADVTSEPHFRPSPAMMWTAIENWVLTAITVTLKVTVENASGIFRQRKSDCLRQGEKR